MEVSALKYSGGVGLHGRSPLLRLQSDERLISLLRRGNTSAFEVLVARYESRLMAFCRHLLGSREDAEDVMQEVMTAAFNAILADDRPINVRPWLYRIARNRSLNHLRRAQAIGVDSMDHHLSEHGATTADKVHEREEFRLLVGDIHELPETQKTALVLREMDALSYEQIAEAMETTVPSVKSLLVRARVSLAEAAEARLLSCDQVRIELAEIAEGLQRRPTPLVRRHLRSCKRCTTFRSQLKQTNRALAALLPVGPIAALHKVLFFHLGHSAASGSTASATAAGASAAGAGAAGAGAAGAGAGAGAAGAGAMAGSAAVAGGAAAGSSGLISAGIGALAGKAAAGLAAAALVTAGAVEAGHSTHRHLHRASVAETPVTSTPAPHASVVSVAVGSLLRRAALGRAGQGRRREGRPQEGQADQGGQDRAHPDRHHGHDAHHHHHRCDGASQAAGHGPYPDPERPDGPAQRSGGLDARSDARRGAGGHHADDNDDDDHHHHHRPPRRRPAPGRPPRARRRPPPPPRRRPAPEQPPRARRRPPPRPPTATTSTTPAPQSATPTPAAHALAFWHEHLRHVWGREGASLALR